MVAVGSPEATTVPLVKLLPVTLAVVPLLIASWVLKTSTASWPLEPELRATLLRPKVSLVALSWPPEFTAMVQVYPVAVKVSPVAVIVPLTAIGPAVERHRIARGEDQQSSVGQSRFDEHVDAGPDDERRPRRHRESAGEDVARSRTSRKRH